MHCANDAARPAWQLAKCERCLRKPCRCGAAVAARSSAVLPLVRPADHGTAVPSHSDAHADPPHNSWCWVRSCGCTSQKGPIFRCGLHSSSRWQRTAPRLRCCHLWPCQARKGGTPQATAIGQQAVVPRSFGRLTAGLDRLACYWA